MSLLDEARKNRKDYIEQQAIYEKELYEIIIKEIESRIIEDSKLGNTDIIIDFEDWIPSSSKKQINYNLELIKKHFVNLGFYVNRWWGNGSKLTIGWYE